MQKFHLTGLAEGLLGKSVVEAHSEQDLFDKYPVLGNIKHKISFRGNKVMAINACDG